MTTVKLNKIVIRNFGEYHGEIKLKDCTLVNCVYLTSKEINEFSKILKFLFSPEDDIADIMDLKGINFEAEDNCPVIEAHIQTSEEKVCVMRKSCKNKIILYDINGSETTSDRFKDQMREYGCLFSFTWYGTQKTIEAIMNLNDKDRTIFLEDLCNNLELKTRYNQHKTKMEELEFEMKFLNDHKKELYMEKKMEKSKIENSKKIKAYVKEYEEKNEQLKLLKLYKNEKLISETIPTGSRKMREVIENLKVDCRNAREEFNAHLKKVVEAIDSQLQFTNLTKNKRSILECEKALMSYKNKLGSLIQEQKFSELVRSEYLKLETCINNETLKLLNHHAAHSIYEDSIEEYKVVERRLCESHYDYLLLLMTMEQIKMIETGKISLNSCKMQLEFLNEEQAFYDKQIKVFNEEKSQMEKKLKLMESNRKQLKINIVEIENSLKGTKAALIEKLNHEDSIKRNLKNVLRMVTEKFPGKIIGILSELFDVKSFNGIAITKSQVIECLGDYENAFVVENNDVMGEIKSFIRTFQKNVILLPQYHFPSIVTPTGIRTPGNIKTSKIENFLKPISEEVRKILMYILKERIICDGKFVDQVMSVFNTVAMATKRQIPVTSFYAGITIYTKDKIQFHSKETRNVLNMGESIFENKEKLILMQCQLELINYKYFMSHKKFSKNQTIIKFMTEFSRSNQKIIDMLKLKIAKFEDIVAEENSENFRKIRDLAEKLNEKFEPIIENYFRSFCSQNNFPSIQEYQKGLDQLKFYETSQKFFNETLRILNKARINLKRLLITRDWSTEKEEIQSKIEQQSSLEQTLMAKNNAQSESESLQIKWKAAVEKFLEVKEKYLKVKYKLKLEILKDFKLCNIDKMLLINENYQLMINSLMDYENISLKEGSLLSLITPPTFDIDDDFYYVTIHLSSIQPDFEFLTEELKNFEVIDDTIKELEEAVTTLKNDLDNYPYDFTSNEEHELGKINEKINGLSMDIKDANSDCQNVLGALKTVIADRKDRFNNCLNTFNQEIQKYCEVISNGNMISELIPVNEDEPYLDALQYVWQAPVRNERNIDGYKKNWEESLAFFLGILCFKEQRFLPYFEVSSEVPILNALIKYSSSERTNFQTIIFWKTGIEEERCHYTIMKFNNKINIFDNEKLQEITSKMVY